VAIRSAVGNGDDAAPDANVDQPSGQPRLGAGADKALPGAGVMGAPGAAMAHYAHNARAGPAGDRAAPSRAQPPMQSHLGQLWLKQAAEPGAEAHVYEVGAGVPGSLAQQWNTAHAPRAMSQAQRGRAVGGVAVDAAARVVAEVQAGPAAQSVRAV